MSKQATKYVVIVGDELQSGTHAKKAAAVEAATNARDEHKLAVRVETTNGKVVFEQAAPKKIKMSPQFTRTVTLPEGVEVPEGRRVAYVRARKGVALLHNPEAEKTEQYSFFDYIKGVELEDRFETTREAGQAFKLLPALKKAEPATADA